VATEGWSGWDEYARFYDWENAHTFGRRDVAFWRRLAANARPPILELGCGTGRVLVPLARAGVRATGIDRSGSMLERAAGRARRLPLPRRPSIVRGDIRALPFRRGRFGLVIAAYGLVQSILSDSDLDGVLTEISRVLKPRGVVAFDLVPDLTRWEEYTGRERFRGRSQDGSRITLIETVRQQRSRGLTTFQETFVERARGRETRHKFVLTFRTVPLTAFVERLQRFDLEVESVFGDYRDGLWTEQSDACLIVAKRRDSQRS